jgi:KTSC domain
VNGSLSTGHCRRTERSMDDGRVRLRCSYDEKNTYMLINLSGTWYHYCEIDPGTVSSLLAADSMGRYFNTSIKGNFDCRTHRVPAYP